jgi:hypothetical protein
MGAKGPKEHTSAVYPSINHTPQSINAHVILARLSAVMENNPENNPEHCGCRYPSILQYNQKGQSLLAS